MWGKQDDPPRTVLLYVPNLIGYLRIVLVMATVHQGLTNWRLSAFFYVLSFALDALDGFAARLLGQTSRLGVVLDMITDRLATAALLTVLSHLYPQLRVACTGLLALDISSHWCHMYRSEGHHKAVAGVQNPVLRAYYRCKPLFAYACVAAEVELILLYTLAFQEDGRVRKALMLAMLFLTPGWSFKQLTNLLQLTSSFRALAEHAAG